MDHDELDDDFSTPGKTLPIRLQRDPTSGRIAGGSPTHMRTMTERSVQTRRDRAAFLCRIKSGELDPLEILSVTIPACRAQETTDAYSRMVCLTPISSFLTAIPGMGKQRSEEIRRQLDIETSKCTLRLRCLVKYHMLQQKLYSIIKTHLHPE